MDHADLCFRARLRANSRCSEDTRRDKVQPLNRNKESLLESKVTMTFIEAIESRRLKANEDCGGDLAAHIATTKGSAAK